MPYYSDDRSQSGMKNNTHSRHTSFKKTNQKSDAVESATPRGAVPKAIVATEGT
jgi:hypothetical protein